MLAPGLKATDLKGRRLVIHAGADNFSDNPVPGAAPIVCGTDFGD
jgi:Cu-Zn family superoxide dismutase